MLFEVSKKELDISMITKATRRKVELFWNSQCAICGSNDYLEVHHIIPKSENGTDDYDNLILLCACCHAVIHNRTYNKDKVKRRTSIDYELAVPILDKYFSNEIGTKETKEKLNLSPKTHLSESSVYKRYKREHHIEKFYNNVDMINSKRRSNV
ncbi:MAG: HNH endonuclease [Lachnospiraceae bacterium]|nr:HNH endonuclease [Lachnospiraceae bacterium]